MSQSPLKDATSTDSKVREAYLNGWEDLVGLIRKGHSFSGRERNCAFLNMGPDINDGTRFSDVSSAVGLDLIDDARGMAVVDWDHDGDLDLWLANRTGPRARLMLNEINSSPSYVALKLQGTHCNRDAIGARVELVLGDEQSRIKTLRAGEGFLSQSSKLVHFGLAAGETVDEIRVTWPGNDEPQRFRNVQANGRYHLIEGERGARILSPKRTVILSDVAFPSTPTTGRSRIVITQRTPMPEITWRQFEGDPQAYANNSRGMLLNLWASWCTPCQKELEDLRDNGPLLQQHGIKVLALSVDEDSKDAQQHAAKLKLPFEAGMATVKLLESLTTLDHQIFYRQHPLPLPCSFLVDAKGRLAVIYKGGVTAEQITNDARLLDAPLVELADAAQPFAGRRVASWFSPGHISVARAYLDGGYVEDAKRELRLELQQPFESSNHVRALQILSELAASEKDTQLQLSTLKALQTLQPENRQVQLQHVVVLASMGNSKEARQRLSEIAGRIGDDPEDLVMLAQVYGRLGDPQRAITVLERAVAIDPNHVEARLSMAIARQLTGDNEIAITEYRNVLATNPDRLDAANNLAWLLATQESAEPTRKEAVDLARRVCEQTHYSKPAYLDTLAVALQTQGAHDDAVKVLKQAIALAKGRGELELMKKMVARLNELTK